MTTLEARQVGCSFGDCVAVREASVRIVPGRIHALVGENGAGKSTLLRMLAGAQRPTAGTVLVDDRPLSPATPAEAIRRGVGMVYQHFALVEAFTGLENLMLGVEPVTGPPSLGVLAPDRMRARAREVADRTGLDVPLERPVSSLGIGERQRLEILRVLVRGATALLLDEPTAVLTRAEADGLYALLRRLAGDGATVCVVTHHLDEVVEHADVVTIMRRGAIVHEGPAAAQPVASLARLALGEIAAVTAPVPPAEDARAALAVRDLSLAASAPGGVTLSVRAGEIVGVAGVDGNGQDELVLAIAGLASVAGARGRVELAGRDVTRWSPGDRLAGGLGVVHGDRHRFGLLAEATVHDNLVLADAGASDEDATVARRLAASGAQPSDPALQARALSGGNQQKLVVARALDRAPRALVAAYPTRGIDAAAAAHVHARLRDAAAAGAGVLLLSGDVAELRTLAHRLVVLYRGAVVAELAPDVDEATLGGAMLGGGA